MQRVEENEETTLRSEGTSLLKKSLTEPALLEMSGKRGGLNGSTQHLLEATRRAFSEEGSFARACNNLGSLYASKVPELRHPCYNKSRCAIRI